LTTDDAPPEGAETPMQKALRLKKAAQAARPAPPARRGQRDPGAAGSASTSKPWMTR